MFDQRGQEIIGWGATSTEYNIGGALDRPVPGTSALLLANFKPQLR